MIAATPTCRSFKLEPVSISTFEFSSDQRGGPGSIAGNGDGKQGEDMAIHFPALRGARIALTLLAICAMAGVRAEEAPQPPRSPSAATTRRP